MNQVDLLPAITLPCANRSSSELRAETSVSTLRR